MAAQEKKVINLFRGWPGPPLLPAQEVREAAARALSDPAVYNPGLLYGPDAGFRPLRSSLANWLGATYNVEPDPARICITGGASQSLACLLTSFTDPAYTRAVWMAAPCYFLASSVFEDAGFRGRLHAVPEDDEGASAEFLAQALEGFPEGEPGTGHPVCS